ncbi:hypothetical protein BOTBODRAFT_109403, partial [Botryobasidium botryosum FD-172 SS1]
LGLEKSTTLVLALVTPCKSSPDTETGIHHYTQLCTPEIIDAQCIQSVVSRMFFQGRWAIIDRGGEFARAEFKPVEDDN